MSSVETSKAKQEIGGAVTDFTLPVATGGTADLNSILAGKKGAVIVFWSETCSHCLRYDAYFNEFERSHPELGFAAIASRHGETMQHILSTAAERRLQFPILHDADGRVAKEWHTQQTPRAFLIDAERRLLYRGAVDNYKYKADREYQPYLEPAVEAFLAGRPVERPETASFGCAIQSVYYLLPKPLSRR